MKRGRKPKIAKIETPVNFNNNNDLSKPPSYIHYGYRADFFPRESGLCRWWLSQGWNGQFDMITWEEKDVREKMAIELGIKVFDYDEMCLD